MVLYALFAKIDGKWRFEGLQEVRDESYLSDFTNSVEKDNGPGTAHIARIELPE